MQLDIAVESVLTANGALLRGRCGRLLPRVDAMRRPQHRRALRGDGRPACSTSRPTSGCGAFSRRACTAPTPTPAARHDVPRRRAAGGRREREQVRGDRATRPAASCTWRWTTARTRPCSWASPRRPAGRARSPRARASSARCCPYDRAVHTPLFAPVRRGPARGLRRARRCGRPTARSTRARPRRRYPDDPDGDPRAARRALDEPGRVPRDDRGAVRRGRAVFVEAGPRGNLTAFVEDILRGRPSCAVAADVPRRVGRHPAQPPGRPARRARRRRRPRASCTPARDAGERRLGGRRGRSPGRRAAHPALDGVADADARTDEALERLRPSAPAPPASARPALVAQADARAAGQRNGARPRPATARPPAGGAAAARSRRAPPCPSRRSSPPATTTLAHGARGASPATMERVPGRRARRSCSAYLGAADARRARRTPPGRSSGRSRQRARRARSSRAATVDPAEDRYLRDHTLGRASRAPTRRSPALALMPLTMSLEILAEAAAALVPGPGRRRACATSARTAGSRGTTRRADARGHRARGSRAAGRRRPRARRAARRSTTATAGPAARGRGAPSCSPTLPAAPPPLARRRSTAPRPSRWAPGAALRRRDVPRPALAGRARDRDDRRRARRGRAAASVLPPRRAAARHARARASRSTRSCSTPPAR